MTTLQERARAPVAGPSSSPGSARRAHHVDVVLVSFAALLIEICYTRVVSYKLFYYYTYLVIGLALLGIGTGGVLVAVSARLRRARTDVVVAWSFLLGGAAVVVGYVVSATVSVDTLAIWRYDGSAASNVGALVGLCLLVFASFVAPGVVVATLFGRRPEGVGGLYAADLAGAGVACAVVIVLTGSIGPPATIMLAAAVLFVGGALAARRLHPGWAGAGAVLAAGSVVLVVAPGLLPAQRIDTTKAVTTTGSLVASAWSSIFRVDAYRVSPDVIALYHDGIIGSAIYRFDGRVASLAHYDFGADARSIPFAVAGRPPRHEAIIGAAGGHEVLASLWFGARHVDAVELNPVTYSFVRTTFARFDGHLAQDPAVSYLNADGRSYLARSHSTYDMIWYPAPDSYAATNAATASAYVLSESYLYTTDAIVDALRHLGPHGLFVAQFGEVDYAHKPYRTTRFVATARRALADLGVVDPGAHIMVATSPAHLLGSFTLSTILVQRDAFSAAQVRRFASSLPPVPGTALRYAPGRPAAPGRVATGAAASDARLRAFEASYRYDVVPTTDDQPFFWHVARFGTVLGDYFRPITGPDREDQVGERVLVLLLAVCAVISALFLLLPFVAVRRAWRRMARKRAAVVFFAATGFGFMFFEITLMQLLNLFLGYPTYALTVTLMALLVSSGAGAMLSGRLSRPRRALALVVVAVAALTAFYLFGLVPLTTALLGLALAARVVVTVVLLAPLGLCLGLFLPLGLRTVASLGTVPREYVAWGWAVNGFASVTGAVLATLLAMAFGFHVVLGLGLVAYLVAAGAWRLLTAGDPTAAAA